MDIDKAQVSVSDDGNTATITGGGSLTILNCQMFSDSLRRASLEADDVLVDLRAAFFIDTQIIADLGQAAMMLRKRDKRLRVFAREGTHPLRVMQITSLRDIMDIERRE